jgi:hypothetical protein
LCWNCTTGIDLLILLLAIRLGRLCCIQSAIAGCRNCRCWLRSLGFRSLAHVGHCARRFAATTLVFFTCLTFLLQLLPFDSRTLLPYIPVALVLSWLLSWLLSWRLVGVPSEPVDVASATTSLCLGVTVDPSETWSEGVWVRRILSLGVFKIGMLFALSKVGGDLADLAGLEVALVVSAARAAA